MGAERDSRILIRSPNMYIVTRHIDRMPPNVIHSRWNQSTVHVLFDSKMLFTIVCRKGNACAACVGCLHKTFIQFPIDETKAKKKKN